MILGTPDASLIGNMLTGRGTKRAGKKVLRAAEGNNTDF